MNNNMGVIKLTLTASTLKELNNLATEFEETRNLGGSLRIIAIKARAIGDSIEKIADLVRTTKETVRNWIREFRYQGVRSLTPRISPRRPRSLTPEEEKVLKKTLENPLHQLICVVEVGVQRKWATLF